MKNQTQLVIPLVTPARTYTARAEPRQNTAPPDGSSTDTGVGVGLSVGLGVSGANTGTGATPTGTGTGTGTGDAATGTDTAGTGTATDTGTATVTDTATGTNTATATDTGTGTATNTGTDTNTGTATGTGTSTGTATGTSTGTATGTSTGTATGTSTGTATGTSTGTNTATTLTTPTPTSPTSTAGSTLTIPPTATSSSTTSPSSTTTPSSTTPTPTSSFTSSASGSITLVPTTSVTTLADGETSTSIFLIPSSLSPSPESDSSMSPSTRTAVITGATVGGVLLLALLGVLGTVFCWRRRKNRKLGFIEGLMRKRREGKGAGGVGLLDDEFDDDDDVGEYRDEIHMRSRSRDISAHSPQPSLAGSTPLNPHNNSPYNTAPTLYRARASDSGSMFHEEDVWPPPSHGSQFVDPFMERARESDVDLSGIVDRVMGPTELPPGAAPAAVPGIGIAAAGAGAGAAVMGHAKQTSAGSIASTTPKKSSPLADRTSTASSIGQAFNSSSPPPTSPTTPTQPKNWLERSPRNAAFSLPPLASSSSTHPPSAFAASSSSLANAYGTGGSGRTTPTQKHISWGELPKPPSVGGGSRPGSRQGSNAG